MDDWEYVESRFENLDRQLEYAKKHVFHVELGFEKRFRVWLKILDDRILLVQRTCNITDAIRVHDLTVRDVVRLYKRATKEFMVVADNVHRSKTTLKFFQSLYADRKEMIMNSFSGFINDLNDVKYRG